MSYYNVHSLCAIIQLKKKISNLWEKQRKASQKKCLKVGHLKKKKGRQEKRPTGTETRTKP